ncbi:hypothetical protein KKD19_00540 [Patescibacteria group bacterium]|nr:hypothetical protein [Patescibacteria group bacterium]MBU4511720.1 hypothetical protein [Patescibacteria group bacterium]MCG2692841.1 hypothetical protein [Candidatus Parcubacteria bacterium]
MKNFEKGFNSENENNHKERESAVNRIVNLSESEENRISEEAKGIFQKQEKLPIEHEKTEREMQIIQDILIKLPEFLSEYEIESLNLTPNHIHVVNEASLSADQKKTLGIPEKAGGFYMEPEQGSVVFDNDNDLTFAEDVAHESLHANSFISFTAKDNDPTLRLTLRRVGLTILDKNGRRYFHDLNEAITEELTKRFDRKYFNKMPSLSRAIKKREEYIAAVKIENPDNDTEEIGSVRTVQISSEEWETTIKEYEYQPERKELSSLINAIYEKNKTQFASPEDVFRLFVKAAFTGRMIGIAHLIKNTFGKNSFRQLAEKTEHKKKG